MMDRFLAPHSPEALAHNHLTENWFTWDQDHPSFNETLAAGCATYDAFKRFLTAENSCIPPQSRPELESVLRRYAYDAIHNTIARSRLQLEKGGYVRMCHLVEVSISKVLNENDNAASLLELRRPMRDMAPGFESSEAPRSVRIK